MSSVGEKIEKFELPVCNIFEARILNDQLCYEVDINKFSNKDNLASELKLGFAFIMDYNEDRQVIFNTQPIVQNVGLTSSATGSDQQDEAIIYLHTIGR